MDLARRGSRQLTDHVEEIEDQSEAKQIKRQARNVLIKSNLVSLALTFLTLLLP